QVQTEFICSTSLVLLPGERKGEQSPEEDAVEPAGATGRSRYVRETYPAANGMTMNATSHGRCRFAPLSTDHVGEIFAAQKRCQAHVLASHDSASRANSVREARLRGHFGRTDRGRSGCGRVCRGSAETELASYYRRRGRHIFAARCGDFTIGGASHVGPLCFCRSAVVRSGNAIVAAAGNGVRHRRPSRRVFAAVAVWVSSSRNGSTVFRRHRLAGAVTGRTNGAGPCR